MCDLWNKRREQLEQAVKDAAMELFGHTSSAAFRLDLGSGLYVEAGPEGAHLTQPAQAVDVEKVREERDSQQRAAIAAIDRAERAEALLRECHARLSTYHPADQRLANRITTHLSENSRG